MAHWKKGFPSRYLQVSDLDVPIVATIASVKAETIGTGDDQELKLVVRFTNADVKACVLNLTRAEAIETIVGDPDTDTWVGHRIKLVKGMTRYQGKRVACISVEAPGPRTTDDVDDAMPTLESEVL